MTLSFRLRARPNGGLDARFKAAAEKRGCHKLSDPQRQRLRGVRTPEARSCTNEVRKRAALTATRASAEAGTKRGRLGWWVSWSRKDDDGGTIRPYAQLQR